MISQNKNSLNQLFLLQKKAIRIISFECRNAHSSPFFYKHGIGKLNNMLKLQCLLIDSRVLFGPYAKFY